MWPSTLNFSRTLGLVSVIFLTACTDLTAVREWSKASLEATQFSDITETYANTPKRLMRYDKQDVATQESWKSQHALRQAQAEALQSLLSVIGDYMATVSTLSAGGTVDYSKEAKEFTGSLQKLNKIASSSISNKTIGAVGSLVQTIANAALSLWQAKEVAKTIEKANKPLQAILGGELRSIIDKDFRRDLTIEKSFFDIYFRRLIRHPKTSEAAGAALDEWYQLRKRENEKRQAAVGAYVKIIDVIAEGHQNLFDNRNDLDKKRLVKKLFSSIKELRKNIIIITKSY